MSKLDQLYTNYITEQSKNGDFIRLKEKVKVDDGDFWDALTVVEIIKKNGNKYTLKSMDGTTTIVDLTKLKYEKV